MEHLEHRWGLQDESARSREIFCFGGFELEPAVYELRSDGNTLELGTKSLSVLIYLVRMRDRMVPRSELLAEVWPGVCVGSGSLTQAIWEIRAALDDRSREQPMIQTLRGRGYRFTSAVECSLLTPGAPAGPVAARGSFALPAVDWNAIEMRDVASILERSSGTVWPSALRHRVHALSKDALLTALELARVMSGASAAGGAPELREREWVERSA